MIRHLVARTLGDRLSRRSAVGRLAGAGAALAMATGGLGVGRGAALGATAPAQSSAVTRKKGMIMTDATPSAAAPLTVVLVHGAFADSSGWNGVVERLQAASVPVVAVPNPLRGLAHDAAYVASWIAQIPGPVLAVGHSYGGAVITNAAAADNVVGLVYVAGFAPDEGETLLGIEQDSRDSVLITALVELRYPTGQGTETAIEYAIAADKFHEAFAADVPVGQAAVMAATQRPIAQACFAEPTANPAWKSRPSWAIVPSGDYAIGSDALRSMAQRSGAKTVEVEGSHAIMVSQPQAVTDVILTAVAAVS